MRYKIYIFTAMLISNVFSQGEISLKSVLDGTFSTESIGRYTWKNSTDSYYFSKKSDSGLDFYIYNLASNDTTKSFSIPKSLINNFSYSFSPNQKKLLLKKNLVKIWRHSSYGSYYIYDIESSSLTSVTSNPDR